MKYLFIRGLRHVDHTVFVVENGQKSYYDPVFGRSVPYSSGQQVKRSLLNNVLDLLDEPQAPITFNYQVNKEKAIENKEPWSPCDPQYTDQLLGGWMQARPGVITVKRRSPLSISAMRPLHPLLASLPKENLTFDRSERPDEHPVRVLNDSGQEMSPEDILGFLQSNARTLPRRLWIPDNTRATGLFVFDIAIDLSTLFSVSINQHDPEVTQAKMNELIDAGWKLSNDKLRIICPSERRKVIIPALANALVNWRVSTNQSRTYSPQETLAFAISNNANKLVSAIRGELKEDSARLAAIPIVRETKGVHLFTMPVCGGYVEGAKGSDYALDDAEIKLIELLSAYDYDGSSK